MKKVKLFVLNLIIMAVCIAGFTACNKSEIKVVENIYAMDTVITITCYGYEAEEAVELAIYEIKRLDGLWSVNNTDSEVYRINEGNSVELSEDTLDVLKKSDYLYRTTEGAFDVTIRPLVKLWGFEDGILHIPDKEEIKDTLALCGFDKLKFSDNSIMPEKGMGIDFGGIAKGYASSRLMEIFGEFNIRYAIVSLGGNIQCYGKKPDGSLFNIAVRNPDKNDDNEIAASIRVGEKAVITSGGYERFLTDETTGRNYSHIIDAATGYPVENNILSVTVISSDGMLADGLSTAFCVMGIDKSIEYWKKYGGNFDFAICDENKKIYITEGIENVFESDYDVIVIRK